jgi:hypothetical protein
MIQYPTATSQPPGAREPDVPAAIRNACRIMYAGAVVSAVHTVVVSVTSGAMKAALQQKHPHLSAAALSTLTNVTVIATAVVTVIGAVLFVAIARACGRGKNSARITAAVLAVLGLLAAFYDVSAGRSTVNLIFSFGVAAIGFASVALLWQRDSGAYFRYFKRPQL